jgi:hypothetical protein
MTSIYCDDIYNCEYSYLDEPSLHDSSIDYIDPDMSYELLDTAGLISLVFLGIIVTTQFGLLAKSLIQCGKRILKPISNKI